MELKEETKPKVEYCNACGNYYILGGGCPSCTEEQAKEDQSYIDDGYIEVDCPYCNKTQWMIGHKIKGICCECGERIYNEECEDFIKEKIEEFTQQRNKLNRRLSALKKATLNN